MRTRLALLATAVALIGPTPLVTGGDAAPLVATPLCGDSSGRTRTMPDRAPAAMPAPVPDLEQVVTGGRHHKPGHKPVPPTRPPSPPKPPAPPPPPPPPPSVRIATVNLLHGLDDLAEATLEQRLQVQAQQLVAAGVDVIGAQEVSRTTNHGTVALRLAQSLAGRSGRVWYWCFFATNPYAPGEPETRTGGGGPLSDLLAANARPGERKFEEGVAIISRYPVLAAEAFRLPPETLDTLPDCEEEACALRSVFQARAALWGRVRSNIGDVDVFSAHTSGTARQHSALTGFVAQKSGAGRAAVVACDCNAPVGEELQPLSSGYVDTYRTVWPREAGWTSSQRIDMPFATVDTRIDYVWLRNRSPIRPVHSEVILDDPVSTQLTRTRVLWPSDHYGVVTTFVR